MGDITKNLSRHEWLCKCGCGLMDPHPLLTVGIQDVVRIASAEKVLITSGSRCRKHNKTLVERREAAPGSKHQPSEARGGYTLAADCVFVGPKLSFVLAAVRNHEYFKNGGVGLYLDGTPRVHLDVRGTHARWGVIEGKPVPFQVALTELYKREGA